MLICLATLAMGLASCGQDSTKITTSSPIASTTESDSSKASEGTSSSTKEKKELLTNGDFASSSIAPFTKSDFEGASSEVSIVNGEMKVGITTVSWGQASPRIEYNGLSLTDKKIYSFSFDAYSKVARTIHAQVGQVLTSDPWFKAGADDNMYFDLTTEKTNFQWSFTLDSTVAKADVTNISLLIELGTMSNGATSAATDVFFDNVSLKEADALANDTIPPTISLKSKEYFYVGEVFKPLEYMTYRDNSSKACTAVVDTENSILPSVDADKKITAAPGKYKVRFKVTDAAGNIAIKDWGG